MTTFKGTAVGEALLGSKSDDELLGFAGNDTLTGGQGDDYLDGGADNDTAEYTGLITEYGIEYDEKSGAFTITDSVPDRDGIDTVIDVDVYNFGKATKTLVELIALATGVVVDDYAADSSTTGLITVGTSVSGNIEQAGDEDWFAITLLAGQSYTFSLDASVTAGLGNPKLWLYTGKGAVLDFNDNANSSGLNSQISYIATTSGKYYLGATGADTGTGAYMLSVAISGSVPDTTAPTVSSFSPATEVIGVNISENIVFLFSESVARGSGNIVLMNASGDVIEIFNVATSSNLSISGSVLTINPTFDLSYGTNYKIELDASCVADLTGNNYAGTNEYNFSTLVGNNIVGGAGDDILIGSVGDDTITGGADNDTIDGGGGIDSAAFPDTRTYYTVTKTATGYTVKDNVGTGGTDTLENVERLSFSDSNIALTMEGVNSGTDSTARYNALSEKLYVAYFGRPADPSGFQNMASQLSEANAPTIMQEFISSYDTNATVTQILNSFGSSSESGRLYTGTNSDFVTAIFQNLFGRNPAGTFWIDALNNNQMTRSQAAMNIMAAAEINTSAQGIIDAAAIANKIVVAANFTTAIVTPGGYSGSTVAESARNMLHLVNQGTNVIDFQSSVESTLNSMGAGTLHALGFPPEYGLGIGTSITLVGVSSDLSIVS